MCWKRKKLERLFDESRAIALLNRLYADKTDLTFADHYAYAMRQIGQSELSLEVERLTNRKGRRMWEEQKRARAPQEVSAEATREQDPVRLIERLEKLKRALDERHAKIRRDQKSPATAA